MILWDRRRAWLNAGLAGLESALLATLVLWFFRRPAIFEPLRLAVQLWVLQCFWMVVLDLFDLVDLSTRAYRRAVLLGIVITSPLLVRLLAYAHLPAGSPAWAALAWDGLFDWHDGVPNELMAILVNFLLWARAMQADRRNLYFLSLSNRVRWMWLLVVGVSVLAATRTSYNPMPVLLFSFPAGLIVLIIGRIEEKSGSVATAGRELSWGHLAQFLLFTLIVAFLGWAPQLLPVNLLLGWAEAVLSFIFFIVMQGVLLFVFLLYPVVVRAIEALYTLFRPSASGDGGVDPYFAPPELLPHETDPPVLETIMELPVWVVTAMRFAGILLLVSLAVLVVLVAARTLRPRRRRRRREDELVGKGGGQALFRRGLEQLRDVIDMARRIGVNQQLLAAISVQNIYANLSRIAANRGHPRRTYQSPDRYLSDLIDAFGGYTEPLTRITDAYMRVHYGDQTITRADLRQVQADYQTIRTSHVQPE